MSNSGADEARRRCARHRLAVDRDQLEHPGHCIDLRIGLLDQCGRPDIGEERLTEGLAFLAAELGITAPAAPAPVADARLLALCDAEVEDAAREAYQRDYVGYGFGRWRA